MSAVNQIYTDKQLEEWEKSMLSKRKYTIEEIKLMSESEIIIRLKDLYLEDYLTYESGLSAYDGSFESLEHEIEYIKLQISEIKADYAYEEVSNFIGTF